MHVVFGCGVCRLGTRTLHRLCRRTRQIVGSVLCRGLALGPYLGLQYIPCKLEGLERFGTTDGVGRIAAFSDINLGFLVSYFLQLLNDDYTLIDRSCCLELGINLFSWGELLCRIAGRTTPVRRLCWKSLHQTATIEIGIPQFSGVRVTNPHQGGTK